MYKRLFPITVAAAAASVIVGLIPAAANAATPSSTTASRADVISTVTNADGTITETIYTPAPGVTAEDLAKRLRTNGVAAKAAVNASADVAASVAACGKGTARTWPSSTACFVRWANKGAVRPTIYFVDSSGASWPVGRSVTNWNKASGIDSIYRTASSGCGGSTTHCVHVYSANYGQTGWTGQTSRTLNAAGTYYASATTKLNDYYGGNESEKWNTACHELGHVLGLDHNTSTTSCLYYVRTSRQTPNTDDYNLLASQY